MAITASVALDDAPLKGKNRQIRTSVVGLTGTYETGGFALTAADLGLTAIDDVISIYVDDVALTATWDLDNSKVQLWGPDSAASTVTGAVADDDDAATNGTAVRIAGLVAAANIPFAYLESTTANNADAVFAVGSGGPTVWVNDNDSPASDELYFDEDATNADSRFLHDMAIAQDVFLVTSTGSFIRVAYDASASSNGVQVYFDDNGSNNYERLLFVSPTDADGSYTTDDSVGLSKGSTLAEVANSTSVTADLVITVKGR